MAIIQDLTIFGDDDTTPLLGSMNGDGTVNVATCSTDPTHPRPYMQTIDSDIVNTSVDFKNGTSTMGGTNVSVVDAPITPGDQTTGWFTQLLSKATTTPDGITTYDTAILMRRAIVRQQDSAGVMRPVFDGIILDPSLDANMVTYHLSLRDVQERGRKQPVFQHAIKTSVVPRGMLDGYGLITGSIFKEPYATGTQMIKPAGWEYGIFRLDPNSPKSSPDGLVYSGRVDLHDARRYSTQAWSDWTTKNADMLTTFGAPGPVFDPNTGGFLGTQFANIIVQWRVTNSGATFKSVGNMPQGVGMQYDTSTALLVTSRGLPTKKGPALSYITISSLASSDLPANGAAVDVRVVSDMPPSADVPMMLEVPFWQLLMDVYDGVYSFEPAKAAKVRYDHAQLAKLLALSPMARAKITEPAEDIYQWVAENIYKPLGYAPGINEQGEVYPVALALPDATTPLLVLNDDNMIPSGTTWAHAKDDAITSTLFTYYRDYVIAPAPASTMWAMWLAGTAFDQSNDYDRLLAQEVRIQDIFVGSTVLFGDKPMTYAPVTVRSVTTDASGLTLTGDVGDELGAQLAHQQTTAIKDRFSQSAQRLTAQCRADDAGVSAAKLGDWCTVGASWLPDYATRKRGMNRLMQIIQIQTPSSTSRTFTLSDAGPFAAPLAEPVIGNLRVSAGSVLVDVTAIPAGGEAEVQYAIAATEPDPGSAMWLLVGRVGATATLSTPSVPTGTTVWMRSIGKGVGKISSAPSPTIHIDVVVLPALTAVSTSLNPATNQVQISWTPLTSTAGIRIAYTVTTDPTTNPALSSTVDVDASLNTTVLAPSIPEGSYLMFTLTPYSAFSGSTASGTAGTVAGWYIQGNLPDGVTGTSTIGPNLVITPAPGPSQYSIAWSGDGVLLNIDSAGYGPPSVSPIVVTLDAGSHSYAFTGTKNGQTVTDSVTVPALSVSGVNTVTPDLTVVQGASTKTTTPFTATASNPSGGAAPTIHVTVTGTTATGSSVGAITPGTATIIPSGEVVTAARQVKGSLPASISFIADLGTGNGSEMIGWPIVDQAEAPVAAISSNQTDRTVSAVVLSLSGANLPAAYSWVLYKSQPSGDGNFFVNTGNAAGNSTVVASGSNSSNPLPATANVTALMASIGYYSLVILTAPLPGGVWLADSSVTVMPTLVAMDAAGSAASAAQGTANAAQNAAATAQSAANTAESAATAAQNTANAANTAASNAATAASNAQSAANSANNAIANISSDNVLAVGEKSAVVQDQAAIANEQSGIDSQATSYGISTEKSAYDSSVSALNSYLAGLGPVAWNSMSGATTIDGPTFRGKFTAVYAARQALLNAIAAAAKVLANNAQGTANTAQTNASTAQNAAQSAASAASAANSAATTAQNAANAAQSTANTANTTAGNAATAASNAQSAANTANTAIANISSDNVLSVGEKSAVVQDQAAIANEQSGIDAQATAYGLNTGGGSYGTPTIVRSTTYVPGSSNTSVVLSFGSAPTAGNLLLALIEYSQYSTTRTVSAPSGWTRLATRTATNDSLDVWYRVASSGDPSSYTFPVAGSNADWASGIIYEISGVNTSSPFAGNATAGAANSSSETSPAVTPTIVGALVISVLGTDTGSSSSGFAASGISGGWVIDQSAIPGHHSTFAAHRTALTADTSTAVQATWTLTSSDYGGALATIVVAPSPPSGGGAEKSTYDAAVTSLNSYLGSLGPAAWNSMSGNTTIDGPTFRNNFTAVYAARQALLNAISAAAKSLADAAQATANAAQNATNAVQPLVAIASNQTDRTVSAVALVLSGKNLPSSYAWGLYKTAPSSDGNYFVTTGGGSGSTLVASGSNSSSPLTGSPTANVTADVASTNYYALIITAPPLGTTTTLASAVVTVMPRLTAIDNSGNLSAYMPLAGGTFSASPPFAVASTAQVNNLNAQYLGGFSAGYFATASSLGGYLTTSAAASTYMPKSGGTFTGPLYIAGPMIGFDSEVFSALGRTDVPHYGIRWGVLSYSSNVAMMLGGYGGVSVFAAGAEQARFSGGTSSIFSGLNVYGTFTGVANSLFSANLTVNGALAVGGGGSFNGYTAATIQFGSGSPPSGSYPLGSLYCQI